jgi:hypothetical protein
MEGRKRTPRGVPTLLAIAAALLSLPAAGHAAVIKFGSNLSKRATISEARGPDAAFWNVGGAALGNAVPADGQITKLRLKGIAVPSRKRGAPRPRTEFHFQVLHPNGGGSLRVMLSTNPMHIAAGGRSNRIRTYRPKGFLCAKRGDYVTFNDEGGFVPRYYPNGVPYRVFASAPGAVTNVFSQDNGTGIGAIFAGSPLQGQELLLQAVLATGRNASVVCGGRKPYRAG